MAQDIVYPILAPWESVNTAEQALHHFKKSPFFSSESNNASPDIPLNDQGTSLLRQMVGVEYVVDSPASSPPDLWVRKR